MLPARAENVAVVRHVLGALGDVGALDDDTLADVRLAVTEACANVVVHAYPERADGPLEVDVRLDEDALAVAVRDEGDGIGEPEEGRGLGIVLIAALSQDMRITRAQAGGTAVEMSFASAPGAGGDPAPELA